MKVKLLGSEESQTISGFACNFNLAVTEIGVRLGEWFDYMCAVWMVRDFRFFAPIPLFI